MELKTARGRLLFFLLMIIVLPFLEYSFNFIKSGDLEGAFVKSPDVQFSFENWWDGNYQKQKALFLNENVGFRPDLVRVNNQIDFSFFKKLHAQNVYLGHDDYFFDKDYVDEYEGIAYMGDEVIRNEIIKLRRIQDTLERAGKTFLLIYAPSKPYYLPEKIPEILLPKDGQKISNYKTFKRIGDSIGLRQLDFNALFMAMKDTAHNLLITKQGYHWSVYGSLLAADSFIKFIERERKIKMPELTLSTMHYSEHAQDEDMDFIKVANLLFPVTKERFSYPEYFYNSDPSKSKPKIIYIGDSFVWQWAHYGLMTHTNSNWEFWYYFNAVWDQKSLDAGSSNLKIDNYNWQRSLPDADCVVAVFTPMNLHLFGSKTFFVEKMYDYYYSGNSNNIK